MSKLENKFQHELIKEIKERFPHSYVMKLDSSYIQGIPDLLILYKNHWAVLECKRNAKASFQPNQKYYIEELNKMSYSNVIYPENKEVVLNEIQRTFES